MNEASDKIRSDCVKISESIDEILSFLIDRQELYFQGLDFLWLKNHVFLQYIINLVNIFYQKAKGKSINNCPSINRLIEYRVTLEKIMYLEKRLKSTIEKQINNNVKDSKSDPISSNFNNLKPNIANMLMHHEENNRLFQDSVRSIPLEEDEVINSSFATNDQNPIISSKKYVPAKMLRVPYPYDEPKGKNKSSHNTITTQDVNLSDYSPDEDFALDDDLAAQSSLSKGGQKNKSKPETEFVVNNQFEEVEKRLSKNDKMVSRKKRRALHSGVLDELRHQFGDRPEEFKEHTSLVKKSIQREFEHRNEYEEDYLIRLNVTKKDKHKLKLLNSGTGALNDITDFRDYKDLMVQAAEEESSKAKSNRRNVKFSSKKSRQKNSYRLKKGKRRIRF